MRKRQGSVAAVASDRYVSLATLGSLLTFIIALFMVLAPVAKSQDLSGNARYSAIVIDAVSGEVLYANRADSVRYPASLTKIMTLYVAFDAISRGELRPDDLIVMSPKAAAASPVKIHLRAGETIDVDTAMKLIALYSANDLSVALAEKIGVTEERFAALMTMKAHELGMTQTNFVNASGLPDARQTTSARDMAILARAVMRDYPQYYYYFNISSLTYRGRTYHNHNPVLSMAGVDGMKTGYINASGYNLVASQMKGGHRLITVMIGGSNKSERRNHVSSLLNIGFDVIDRRNRGETILVAQNEFTTSLNAQTVMSSQAIPYTQLASASQPINDNELRTTLSTATVVGANHGQARQVSSTSNAPDVVRALTQSEAPSAVATQAARSVVAQPAPKPAAKPAAKPVAKATPKKKNPDAVWAIQVGAFKEKTVADKWASDVSKRFRSNLASGAPKVSSNGKGWYRTRFVDLTKTEAQDACKAMTAKRLDCMVIRADG